jgi:2-methylfumaryl-CoA isomerase
MSYAALSARRPDLVMLRLTGTHDGGSAIDYTVNAAAGFPVATGDDERPVNHVLPAWDIAAGLYLSTGLLAAERRRARTGAGGEVTLALSDVAYATAAQPRLRRRRAGERRGAPAARQLALRRLRARLRDGRRAAGDVGRDLQPAVARDRQGHGPWREARPGRRADGCRHGGGRRPLCGTGGDRRGPRPLFAARSLAEVRAAFDGAGVLWGPYQDFGQMVREDPRCSVANPLFAEIDQPGVGRVLAPGSPLQPALPPRPAPRLGADTGAVLAEVLGLSPARIAAYREAGILPDEDHG